MQFIRDALDRYEEEILPELAPRTQKDYRRHLKVLREKFGDYLPDELKPRDIGRFLDVKKGRIHRVRIVAVLSAVYTKMVGRWYIAERNPCQHVEKQKNPPRDRYVTDEEFKAVYDIMPERMQIAMDLALLTGQRQGDLLKLKWSEVLEDGVTFVQSKTGQGRHILFSEKLIEVLTRARRVKPMWPRAYVIRNEDGRAYTSEGFRSIWQRYMRKALKMGVIKERFAFHDLRAKAVSDEENVDIAQLRAGHTSKAMTLRVYSRKIRRVAALR